MQWAYSAQECIFEVQIKDKKTVVLISPCYSIYRIFKYCMTWEQLEMKSSNNEHYNCKSRYK